MRTTLDLDEKLMEEALRVTASPTKTAVVEMGLRALIEQAARRRLAPDFLQVEKPEFMEEVQRMNQRAKEAQAKGGDR